MKKWCRRAVTAVLCVVLLAGLVPRTQAATVYFMAINDTLLELNSYAMPTSVGGVLYVPYTMLSTNVTGVDVGVYATYSSVKNRALVYSNRRQLIFDIEADATYDMEGRTYSERAIVRNSTVYLPIARVCSVFNEIDYSFNNTSYGYLIRVRGSSAVLDDEGFISAAANMMSTAYNRYQLEHPEQSPRPADPSPAHSESVGSGAGAYLGFALEDGRKAETILSALNEHSAQGLFFFTAQQLAQQGELVRRLLGQGHHIGLRTAADNVQLALEELEQARDLLALCAHCRTDIVLAEALDAGGLAQLKEAGFVCWSTTADGRGLEGSASSQSAALMRRMTGGQSARNYLLWDESGAKTLSSVLTDIRQEDYQFRAPVAPEL